MDFSELFPDNREQGEGRLRQSQLVMLRMLKILDYLCTQHGIEYFLIGGSLLGAIRHKGFIPWDDDLDVGMTRANYEKFTRLVVPQLPHDIFFQTPETDPWYSPTNYVEARLRDKYSSYQNAGGKHHEGLQIDLFIYDQAFLPANIFIILQNMWLSRYHSSQKRAAALRGFAHKNLPGLVYASSYLNNLGMVKLGTNFIRHGELKKLVRWPFEDMQVLIPAGWDACLKRQYGNYMQLPPASSQRGAHSDALPDPFTPCNHPQILHWPKKEMHREEKANVNV